MRPSFDWSTPKKSTGQVSILKNLLKRCLELVKNENDLVEILTIIEASERGFQQEKNVNHIHKIMRTHQELRMNAKIGEYDMDFIILNMGSDVNILNKKMWEST